MMKRMAKWIGSIALIVFLGSSLCCAGLPEIKSGNSGDPLRILFIVPGIGWSPKAEIDAAYQDKLKQAGYDVTVVLGTF